MLSSPPLPLPPRCLRFGLLAGLLALFGATAPAGAVPLPATGSTSVYFSSFGALTDLGFRVTMIGMGAGNVDVFQSQFLPSPTIGFRVTEVDPATDQLFHDGSGIGLFLGSSFVTLENFVVNGMVPSISADVSGLPASVEAFSLQDCRTLVGFCIGTDGTTTVDGLGMFFTEAAISALEDVFGQGALGDITSETLVGVANSTFVPEPSTALLVGGGLLVLASRRRD